jgi:hypothetical protein
MRGDLKLPISYRAKTQERFSPRGMKSVHETMQRSGHALMVVAAFSLEGIHHCFNDAVGHSQSQDGTGIPESSVKNHMAHIPHPLK